MAGGGLVLAVAALEAWLVRPFAGGPAASDAASSVLYFDRIVAGRTLEAWLNTTPKPLLTLVYGVLHRLDPSWGLVSLSAVLAGAVGVVLAAEVARRLAGLPAAAFVIVTLAGSVALDTEMSWAFGLPWALLLWSAAALMMIGTTRRPAAAGAFLLLAALVRPETFIVLAVAAGGLVLAWTRGPRPPGRLWLVMIGWLALPVMCLHDLLLTGDPLWWLSVAPHAVVVGGGRARSLPGTILLTLGHVKSMWILVALAIAGGLLLVVRRAWVAVVGLIALGPLVFAYTWALSARHIQVLTHYFHPADMAIVVAAGVAVGAGLDAIVRWLGSPDRTGGLVGRVGGRRVGAGRPGVALLTIVAVLVSLAAVNTSAFRSAGARNSIGLESRLDARVTALLPVIRAGLPARAAIDTPARGSMGSPDDAAVVLSIPAHLLPRMAVDLGLPLTRIAVIGGGRVDLAAGYPAIDSVVYLDGLIDPASVGPGTASLRVSVATVVGAVQIVPIHVDPAERVWIVAIRPAP